MVSNDEFFGEKATHPHLLSAEVKVLVFLTVGKELLSPAEASRENSIIPYLVDFTALKQQTLFSSQMAVLLGLGKGAGFRTGGSSAHAPPWISKGVSVPGLYLTRSTSKNLCSHTCLDKGPLHHLS